jgi:hypothetical protein
MPFFLLLPLAFLSALPSEGRTVAALNPRFLTPAQAQALVERALAAESSAAGQSSHLNQPMRYRLRKSGPRLTSTKEIVETKDGAVALLIAMNDRPLSLADEQREQARLDALLGDPGQQRHRQLSEQQDAGIVLKLLRILPQAFTYEYAGAGQDSSGAGLPKTVEKFRFRPNPAFRPPDLETHALTAMTGEVWIDPAEGRVTRLEGHLLQDTDYGWGILGKLNKGGWVILEQADVAAGQWRIVRLQMKMDLRILFKTKNIDLTEEMTRYAPVPVGIDYQQAIQMLRSGEWSAARPSR